MPSCVLSSVPSEIMIIPMSQGKKKKKKEKRVRKLKNVEQEIFTSTGINNKYTL
jgi:hypothetical protein